MCDSTITMWTKRGGPQIIKCEFEAPEHFGFKHPLIHFAVVEDGNGKVLGRVWWNNAEDFQIN